MNAAAMVELNCRSVAALHDAGFQGFHSIVQLRETAALEVPVERGIYAIVRDTLMPPHFLPSSVGGRYRQKDPTLPVERLKERWVEGAVVLYFSRAPGPGVRNLLQQRIKRHIRFGHGSAIAATTGRAVWQLKDHLSLLFAWMPTPDEEPAYAEKRWQLAFARDYGRAPFANHDQEDDA
jgi:hypothetical protein